MSPLINVLTIPILIFITISKVVVSYSTQDFLNFDEALTIAGRSKAEAVQFPYFASLLLINYRDETFTCGGSLISDSSILTAAHCLNQMKSVEITLGSTNINYHSTGKTKQKFNSSRLIVHPNFNMEQKLNDLGIIKFSPPATLNDHVKVILLPTADTEVYDGKLGTIVVWSKTDDTVIGADITNLRYETNVILANADCKSFIQFTDIIEDTHLCISGAGGKNACKGDSGGPLVVDGVQVGVLSFGHAQCDQQYPSTFTRLSKYIHWINDNN